MPRVVVVGAGIGGLATSIALRETEAEVLVLERAAELAAVELGAGITLWPNAILILDRLGVGRQVREQGALLDCFEQRSHRDRVLTRWRLDEMARRLGAPVCGINRPDLHAALVASADTEKIRTASSFERFEQAPGAVSVSLADGAVESCDVLIGADGLQSKVRTQVLGPEPPRHSGLTMWRANVPYEEGLAPSVDFVSWWGGGAKFVVFRSAPERLSWEAIVTSPPGERDEPGTTIAAIHRRFDGFVDPVHRLIDAAGEQGIFRTDVYDRPPDERWGSGRVTLLGDAAHPMTFAVGQGAAQALEDALAIATALDGASGEEADLEARLRSYERPRIARAAHFQSMAWRLARAGTLESRPAQAIRNTAFALTSPIGWRMQLKDMALSL